MNRVSPWKVKIDINTASKIIKVLLIEDNPGDARLIQEMLNRAIEYQFELTHAENLENGRKLLSEKNFDVVLLDLRLPDSKGFDTLIKVNKQAPKVPIVILTGHSDDLITVDALNKGAQDYLVKGEADRKMIARSIHYAIERKKAETELRGAKNFAESIIYSAKDGIVVFDLQGDLIKFNDTFSKMTGYSGYKLKNMNIRQFTPEKWLEEDAAQLKKLLLEGESVTNYDKELIRKDGSAFPVSLSFSLLTDEEGEPTAMMTIIRDETKRRQSEVALHKLNRALKVLSECNVALVRAMSESELLNKVCMIIVKLGGYRFAWVGFKELDSEKTVQPVAQAGFGKGYLNNEKITWENTEQECYPTSVAIKTGKTYIEKYIQKESGFATWRAKALKQGYKSMVSIPLISNKHPFGALNIYSDEPDAFDEEEVKLLMELSGDLVYGIESLRTRTKQKQAEKELKQSFEKLRRTLSDTVNALASVTEKRDPYTAGHQQRVTQLACAIANKMNLHNKQIEGIRIAGLLHDIGKISVPGEILSKPGKLSEIEFEIIKTHPKVGHDILKTIDFPWPVADIVLQHHERLDGSGYPMGLKDGKILLEAKILGVADVVEAMMTHRPYRPAHSQKVTLDEMNKNKGILYDPQVVDVCLRLFKEKDFKFG